MIWHGWFGLVLLCAKPTETIPGWSGQVSRRKRDNRANSGQPELELDLSLAIVWNTWVILVASIQERSQTTCEDKKQH